MDDLPTRCRDALRRLHEQGRIASPWMAGMLMLNDWRVLWVYPDRLVAASVSGHAMLDAVALAGPLMKPDPHDPATLGCLVAIVREASGGKCIVSIGDGWWVIDLDAVGYWSNENTASVEDAIVVALEALAGQ